MKPDIFAGAEGQSILSKIEKEMPPVMRKVSVAFIRSIADNTDFIWSALPSLVKLSDQESDLLEASLRSAASDSHKKGREQQASKIEAWAHEILALNLYRNNPASFKNVVLCHVPVASALN